MARRPEPPDPELAALARERLARLLGDGPVPARRAAARAADRVEREGVHRERVEREGVHRERVEREGVEQEDEDEDASRGRDRRGFSVEDLEAPRRFTRWHLGVVAAVLLVGLVWGGWSWVRTRPQAVAAPPVVQTASVPGVGSGAGSELAPSTSATASGAGSGGSPPTPSATSSAAALVVHVLGAVRHPGLVRLASGARVQDALRAAGGLRGDADPGELNLAQPLTDGVQVVVGTRQHPEGEVRAVGGSGSGGSGSGSSSGSDGSSAGAGAVVDLNAATVDQLDTLPGVGPVTAQKILDWRQQHGRFTRADELQEVDGIGPKSYARLAPHVRV